MPIFPENTKMINSTVGFFTKDDFAYYLHKGPRSIAIRKKILTRIDMY